MRCGWLRRTPEYEGMDTPGGRIIGSCDYLGDTATDIRCGRCPHFSETPRRSAP